MKRGGSPFFYDFEGSLKTPKSMKLFGSAAADMLNKIYDEFFSETRQILQT